MPCVFKKKKILPKHCTYKMNAALTLKPWQKQSVGSLTVPNNVHIRIDRREREKSLHFEQCSTIRGCINRIIELSNSFIELFNCYMEMSLLKSSLIQLKSSLIQLKSSLIQLKSSLKELESSLIQLKSSLNELKSSSIELLSSLIATIG